MAHNTRLVLLTAILLVAFKAAGATEFIVGGEAGWTIPNTVNGLNYTSWAENSQFVVGDSLVFKNDPDLHSVLSVTGAAFVACNTSESLQEWKKGNIIIKFSKPGLWWFICGTPNHCSAGQAVKITVRDDPDSRTSLPSAPSAARPGTGTRNSLGKSWNSVLILSSIILGASNLL